MFDPVDVQAEMEVTGRVRRAAAEALMEANAKLAEAQAAQAELQAQLEQAKDLQQELEQLRKERSEAQVRVGGRGGAGLLGRGGWLPGWIVTLGGAASRACWKGTQRVAKRRGLWKGLE